MQALEQAPSVAGARDAAARALGRLGDPRAIPQLIEALADSDTDVRQAAVEACVALGALPALEEAVQHHAHAWVRSHAAEALGKLGGLGTTAVLLAALSDAEWLVRASVAEALGKTGAAEAVEALCGLLRDSESTVRFQVVHALQALASPRAIPALVDALERERDYYQGVWLVNALGVLGQDALEPLTQLLANGRLEDPLSDYVREVLERLRTPPAPRGASEAARPADDRSGQASSTVAVAPTAQGMAPDRLVAQLCDGTPRERIEAARALGDLPQARDLAGPLLRRALHDDGAWGVRAAAATSLGALAPTGTVESLVRALHYEGIASAQRAIGDALVRLRGAAVEPLRRILSDAKAEGEYRVAVAALLGRVGADGTDAEGAAAARAALGANLGARNPSVRAAVAAALASHPESAHSVPAATWLTLLETGDAILAAAAAQGLAAHGGESTVELLAASASSDATPLGARMAACGALADIGGARARAALSDVLERNCKIRERLATAATAGLVRLVERELGSTSA